MIMLVQRVVAGLIDDGIVRADTGQGIDVGVGVIARQPTVVEPEHPSGAQHGSHGLLDLALVQLGVAIGG